MGDHRTLNTSVVYNIRSLNDDAARSIRKSEGGNRYNVTVSPVVKHAKTRIAFTCQSRSRIQPANPSER